VPPPVPPAISATASADKDSGNASNSLNALQSNSNGAGNSLTAAMKKSAIDDADDADDAATGAVNTASDATTSPQSAGDNTQTFASALSAIGHAAPATAGALPSTNSSSNSTPDLAALGSVVGASTTATPANATATHSLSVNTPVGSSGFAKELGQQVTWLSGQDVKQAQIRLNPQDLGPLDVKVSVEHGRVDVAFMTQHAATATAVQQGLDQLSQMLGGQGLSLGHTSVGQHASQQQFADQQSRQSGTQTSGESDQAAGSSTTETLQRVAVGLVDAFA
jgi:flagellar hook-length control protein FliK